jgi:hypothetical protein
VNVFGALAREFRNLWDAQQRVSAPTVNPLAQAEQGRVPQVVKPELSQYWSNRYWGDGFDGGESVSRGTSQQDSRARRWADLGLPVLQTSPTAPVQAKSLFTADTFDSARSPTPVDLTGQSKMGSATNPQAATVPSSAFTASLQDIDALLGQV